MAHSANTGLSKKPEGEQHILDEFTCPGVLRGSLLDQKTKVERVFSVTLSIGGGEDSYTSHDGQIWLQLKGRKTEVDSAKLFVKGIVNQETQKKVPFPEILHCVFCGAKGVFLDSLIRSTSAQIVIASSSCLLISGLAESVVKAYSLINNLVDKYRNGQEHINDAAGECLDSRRVFKSLVEGLEDSYTLDLLVLPVLVKEFLLDLVKQSGVDTSLLHSASVSSSKTLLKLQEGMDRPMDSKSMEYSTTGFVRNSTFTLKPNGTYIPNTSQSNFSTKSNTYGINDPRNYDNGDPIKEETCIRGESVVQLFRSYKGDVGSGAHPVCATEKDQVREMHTWYGRAFHDTEEQRGSEPQVQQEENLLSTGSKEEYEHLLKFFTAMGYNEDVVCRVLARTGPREASKVLDLIQQEQAKSDIQVSDHAALPGKAVKASLSPNVVSGAEEDDFVLGVVKKAAATCGYTEDEVAEVYSNLPELTPHELIRELQKMGMKDPENREDNERKKAEEMNEQQRKTTALLNVREKDFNREKPEPAKRENNIRKSIGEKSKIYRGVPEGGRERQLVEPKVLDVKSGTKNWAGKPEHPSSFQKQPFHTTRPAVCGPPQPVYPLPQHPNASEEQMTAPPETPATKTKGPPTSKAGAVTGPQRFLEGLETPFVLHLPNDPGDSGLRQIIIDGSNVAISHGLGTFFSCRGIALAVQYFWNRGHRKITVFVPQWRQKKDPKIKEQHFMTELMNLGLLSLTPSREVTGQRINCYDDRIMLQFAQQTDAVIVTNDNMRDLVDESVAWKEIIKKRLLQYCFAGGLFMVPDDPLGRSGPHLNEFLRTQNSPPIAGSHSFAGVGSPLTLPSSQPRAQTEVLQYRERTPGGNNRPNKSDRGQHQAEREVNRSREETLNLKHSLLQIFPGQESVVQMTLQCYPAITDINELSFFILQQQEQKD
ncbi:NEDD4-binding protein 1 [Hoplias malabaricus]|uniref:NEDD4-binding protein 1 n=1 Tax=Hoplias malabaricus TaxID=27720 RepID=UPI00346254AD